MSFGSNKRQKRHLGWHDQAGASFQLQSLWGSSACQGDTGWHKGGGQRVALPSCFLPFSDATFEQLGVQPLPPSNKQDLIPRPSAQKLSSSLRGQKGLFPLWGLWPHCILLRGGGRVFPQRDLPQREAPGAIRFLATECQKKPPEPTRREFWVGAHCLCWPRNWRPAFWHEMGERCISIEIRTSTKRHTDWHPRLLEGGHPQSLKGFARRPQAQRKGGGLLGRWASLLLGPRKKLGLSPSQGGAGGAQPRCLSYSLTIFLMWKSFFLRDLVSIFLLW